jgi:NADPH:quinone reductase-like Zn-dependent oxidoreductase
MRHMVRNLYLHSQEISLFCFTQITMATQTAIQMKGPGKAEIVTDTPKLRDDYIIVRTVAVALNPVDWKQIDDQACPGAIVGCDYSGVVEQVGKAVKHGPHVGDRVMGMVHGSMCT